MKIGFPTLPQGDGGTKTWLKIFSDYCIDKGHQVSFNHTTPVDVFFTLANYSSKEALLALKEQGAKIIYRMDGIFFDYVMDNIEDNNRFNQSIVDTMALCDHVIYQSQYCKDMARHLNIPVDDIPSSIIYNGTNEDHFTNKGDLLPRPKNKKLLLTIAYWGTYNMAEYSIKHIKELATRLKAQPDIEMWVLGLAYPAIERDLIDSHLENITKINLHKAIEREEMPLYLRSADVVLHIRPNDACSNLIIEAMTTGTPVVGLNLGSTPELLGRAGLMADCTPSWTDFPIINMDSLYTCVTRTFKRIRYYKRKITSQGRKFSSKRMCKEYFDTIKTVMSSKENYDYEG